MTIALAMSPQLAADGGTDEDLLLAESIQAAGVPVELVAWSAGVEWGGFSAVLLRSCWDYHLRPVEFRAWLWGLETAGVRVWNPPSLVRWNMDKRYLLDLAARGVPGIPTVVVEDPGPRELGSALNALGTEEAVVKPSIGATAFGCHRVVRGEAFEPVEGTGPWLVQPFVTSVVTEGEWSLMLFSGRLSHAVLKRAAEGEYRVQKEWGGTSLRGVPDSDFVAVAEGALAALPEMPLYARVDMTRWQGAASLMELELIEPQLFLEPGDVGLEVLVRVLGGTAR